MEKYMDITLTPEQRAKDLLSRLSLEEKMAQTVCIYPQGILRQQDSTAMSKDDCKYGIGSVSYMEVCNLPTPEALAKYQKEMQTMVMEQSPHHIPAIFHMEGVCGGIAPGQISMPANIGRGAGWDPELEKQIGATVSRQEKSVGVSHILAPVLDISRDSRMGRQAECYGEDPTLAAALGVAYIKGIQQGQRSDGLRADAVAKHFAGFHNALGGIHGVESMTAPRLMQEVYCKPFQAAITEADLKGVMPCYCTIDGEATSSSKQMLTDLLRDDMGFDGLCVSDYTAIRNQHTVQGLYESMAENGLRTMEAGMDMEWPKKAAYNDELKEWFATGKADIKVLDRIVERILTAKFRMGLFENPFALEGEELQQELNREEDIKISLRAAEQSLVLLKNNGVLPLKQNIKKIAVIGPHANEARYLFGGYTHISMVESIYAKVCSIAGFDETGKITTKDYAKYPGTQVQVDDSPMFASIIPNIKPNCKSLVQEMELRFPDTEIKWAYGYPVAGNDISRFEEALQLVKEADLCILTLGGRYSTSSISTMGEGVDATNINLPECQDAFITEAARMGKPMVGIHLDGRPISSDIADEKLDAILEAWAPSEMGAPAVVNVLTGKVNPSGKLPVSVAYNAGQIPIFYNHPNGSAYHQGDSIGFPDYVDCPHTPRYYFGYGLSYTSFGYDNMTISCDNIAPMGSAKVSVDVSNIGKVAGTEVVQLYLKDTYASMVRPCMELAGFARVSLEPGESKRVEFEISPSQMAFLNHNMQWLIEKGEIQVLIGSASNDIRCNGKFMVTESAIIHSKERQFYSVGKAISNK